MVTSSEESLFRGGSSPGALYGHVGMVSSFVGRCVVRLGVLEGATIATVCFLGLCIVMLSFRFLLWGAEVY